ncbi:hypothetical protein [Streptomyces pseudovenezuelae]|uniref:Uncharacterized protein n=1 Tax=Streptomyces pseudovenezuelae TaxID=67350 RepID=A0ABT6LSD5_9ACTN|nr:hypothetical protein [Streptomyces pseudovenezuelae]MDH6219234.1 hypothetical protein [Streptomyces pseudovenezuelae]
MKVSSENDSGERRAVENARRVMSGSVPPVQWIPAPTRSAAPAATGAVQRVTKPAVQQGPSYWLYVLEVIAEHHGLPVKALSVAMWAYPTTASRDERQEEERRGNNIEGRRLAVMMTAEALANMESWLDNRRAPRPERHGDHPRRGRPVRPPFHGGADLARQAGLPGRQQPAIHDHAALLDRPPREAGTRRPQGQLTVTTVPRRSPDVPQSLLTGTTDPT